VTRVQMMKFYLGKIVIVGSRALSHEDLIVLALDHERGRLVFAEIGLPIGIERDVGPIVVE
jgi:hypothetical protein